MSWDDPSWRKAAREYHKERGKRASLVESGGRRQSRASDYRGLSPTFAEACRKADERQAKQPRDPHIERLRFLMDEDKVPSIEALYAAFDRERRKYGAPVSIVEALMIGLRERGTRALAEPKVQGRISQLSKEQITEVTARLRQLKPHIAKAWTPEETEQLIAKWGEPQHE